MRHERPNRAAKPSQQRRGAAAAGTRRAGRPLMSGDPDEFDRDYTTVPAEVLDIAREALDQWLPNVTGDPKPDPDDPK